MNRDETIDALIRLRIPKTRARSLNLVNANITREDLSEAFLRGADLSHAQIFMTNLSGADLTFSYMCGVDLGESNLSNSRLVSANMRGACLHGANLSGADMYLADLRGACLRDVNLSGVKRCACADVAAELLYRSGSLRLGMLAGVLLVHYDWCEDEAFDWARGEFKDVYDEVKKVLCAEEQWGFAEIYEYQEQRFEELRDI